MTLHLRIDKENVVHLHNGVLHSKKRKIDTLKFAGKWMDLENIILSKWFLDVKQRKQFTIPENLENNEDPQRDIYGFTLHGK